MRRWLALPVLFLLSLAPALAANVGVYVLAAAQVTTAVTGELFAQTQNLDGMTAASIEMNFQYGSGGTTASGIVQTTFDGTNWRDVARCDFLLVSRVCTLNLSGLTAKTPASYAALASEGLNDGILGNQLRGVITTTGTYVNTTVSIRASVR